MSKILMIKAPNGDCFVISAKPLLYNELNEVTHICKNCKLGFFSNDELANCPNGCEGLVPRIGLYCEENIEEDFDEYEEDVYGDYDNEEISPEAVKQIFDALGDIDQEDTYSTEDLRAVLFPDDEEEDEGHPSYII